MDPLITGIMQNYGKELELYKKKKPESLIKKYFESKGNSDHRLMKTRDNSILIGTIKGCSLNGPSIVKYFNDTIYIGDIKNNTRDGFGYRSFLNSDLIYVGYYKNNAKCGKGKQWSSLQKRWVFDGQWNNDLKNGYGEMVKDKATYKGNWVNDRMEGVGRMEWFDGQKYEGEYFDDLRHGQGTMTYQNGDTYTGMFFKGKPHGKGFYQWANGEIYDGSWENGVMQGDGKIDYKIPVSGIGSMRNNKLDDVHFGLQSAQEWKLNYSKSMQSIRAMQSTIEPNLAMKGHSEYDRLMKDDKKNGTSVDGLNGLKSIYVYPKKDYCEQANLSTNPDDQKKTSMTEMKNDGEKKDGQSNTIKVNQGKEADYKDTYQSMKENARKQKTMTEHQEDERVMLNGKMQK